MATSDFNFESFVRRLRREFSTFFDEGFIMDLEDNWYMGRNKTQSLASLICRKIPGDRLTDWIRNGVDSIQRAPFVPRSRPKYCESEWESPAVKPTCGSSKEVYSETAITETDLVTFQYYVNVLERGIRHYSESDIMGVLSGCPNRNVLEKGLYTIARSAKDLVKELVQVNVYCRKYHYKSDNSTIDGNLNFKERFLQIRQDYKDLNKLLITTQIEKKAAEEKADAEHRHLLEYDQQLKVLKCVKQDLDKRVDDEHTQVLEYDQQLKVLKRENQDLEKRLENALKETIEVHYILARAQKETRAIGKSNNEFEKKLIEIKQELDQTKSELRKAKNEVNSLRNENEGETESVKKHDHQLQLLNQENQDLEDRNKEHEKKMRDKQNELKKTQGNLSKAEEENSRLQKDIERLERNGEDKQRQSAYMKSALQQTLGDNDDLQTMLANAQKEISRLKESLVRVQKDTRTEDESVLKLRKEAERYKQEIDSLKEELQKAKEKTISSQKGLKNAQEETNKLKESLSRVQKETRTEDESGSTLRGEAERYKQERDYVKEELRKAKENTNSSRERIAQLEQNLEEQCRQLANVKSELRQTQEKNEDLQNSQVTAAQLTHENQSIAELSDVNRPTKLAERLSELYDNEWTDAFKAIEDDPSNVASEEDIAKKLKDILRNCFEKCVDISNQQLANIEATLFNPGSGKHTSASRQLTPKQAMTITDLRRETSIFSTENIKQKMCRSFHDSTKYKDLKLFIEKCSELCWLMAVQSPPVVIEDRHRPGDRFNGDVFKAYTKSGNVIEYVVWPPVYLHKGGPLLCKGVAQSKE